VIGLKPLMSGKLTEDEGLFVVQHQYWQETMRRALEAEASEKKA
jgi:benzoate/toluate 1,2-dioxygenase subunit alpha